MGDWKRDLGKLSSRTGGGTVKKCACGREITRPGTDICGVCFSKSKNDSSSRHGSSVVAVKLREGYLEGGYFEVKNDKNYIKEEVFIKWAQDVSADLKQQGLTPAAIRRFFSKLRAVEHKFKANRDFDLAREGVYAFTRDVTYTENRGVTPHLFSLFIERNIREAQKSGEHFRAFVEHFQSVVAYFKDKN
jgi:CRISPR type III-A-associated protein Csm2